MAEILEATKADEAIIALSSYGDRWRNKVMPSYKNHRVKTRKPLMYAPLRQWVHDTFRTYEKPEMEGDDVIGILMTHPTLVPGAKVIVSIDKDMKTIPGEFYNYGKKTSTVTDEAHANFWHLMQTLTGDTTDGYPGCPGIGPVSAEKILAPFCLPVHDHETGVSSFTLDVAEAWKAIVAAYAKAKGGPLSEEVALMNARVARICRASDYDFKKKEVILWQPPK